MFAIVSIGLFMAGTVKGMIGVGLPIVALAILVYALPPIQAIATIIFPILITNSWQFCQSGGGWDIVKRFRLLLVVFVTTLSITTQMIPQTDPQVILQIIAFVVILYCAVETILKPKTVPSLFWEKVFSVIAGLVAGTTGGLTTSWAPPLSMFLLSLRLEREEWIRTVSLIWFVGAIPLTLSYWHVGIINAQTAPLSLYACVPGLVGIFVGERIRKHINAAIFRKILLLVLFIAALNLLRKSLLF
ncbi:MAG: sulfite exporter TauE/SafE family protein [Pseudomonadota bacterium]